MVTLPRKSPLRACTGRISAHHGRRPGKDAGTVSAQGTATSSGRRGRSRGRRHIRKPQDQAHFAAAISQLNFLTTDKCGHESFHDPVASQTTAACSGTFLDVRARRCNVTLGKGGSPQIRVLRDFRRYAQLRNGRQTARAGAGLRPRRHAHIEDRPRRFVWACPLRVRREARRRPADCGGARRCRAGP